MYYIIFTSPIKENNKCEGPFETREKAEQTLKERGFVEIDHNDWSGDAIQVNVDAHIVE